MSHPDIELSAYAKTIGIELDHWDGGNPALAVDYRNGVCGNPGMFHGGVVGGLLELAAMAALEANLLARGSPAKLTPINSTIEYLRVAGEQRTYAAGEVVRAGRRLANVRATAWQDSPDKPAATAIFNIAIAPPEA